MYFPLKIKKALILFLLADCYCKKYKTSFPRNNKKRKTADQTEQTEQPIVSLADMLVMRIDHKLLRDML